MGYRITYGQVSGKTYPGATGKSSFVQFLLCAVLAFLLLTRLFWPEGTAALRELLIPGDSRTTAAAFSALVEDVRQGEALSDALRVFCREVLDDAKNPS